MNKILFYHLSNGTNNYLGDRTKIKVRFMEIKSLLNSTLFIFLLIFFICPTAWAVDYYVDKNNKSARDSNPGTAAMPWKTIQRSANIAKAGDTVYVKKGIYYEWVDVKNSGTAGKPITFKAYPGDKPIIDGTGVAVPNWKALFWSRGNDYITIDGFEIRNSTELLICLDLGDHFVIRNCIAHGNAGPGDSYNNHDGILITHCNYVLVENCEVYHTGANAFSAESSNYVTFQQNYAHDCPHHAAFNIFPNTSEKQIEYSGNNVKHNIAARCVAGIYTRFQKDNEISNNLIYKCGGKPIRLGVHPSDKHIFQANTKIVNNTIADNCYKDTDRATGGILDINATNVIIKNNIIINNGVYTIRIGSGATKGIDISNNLYDTTGHFEWGGTGFSSFSSWKAVSKDSGSLEGDWQFANRSVGNYALTYSSADTIGKGADLTTVGISVDGDLVPPAKLRIVQK